MLTIELLDMGYPYPIPRKNEEHYISIVCTAICSCGHTGSVLKKISVATHYTFICRICGIAVDMPFYKKDISSYADKIVKRENSSPSVVAWATGLDTTLRNITEIER
jgi:hypothetical protein